MIEKKVNFFCNNLGIHRVIICFTIGLCIKKKKTFLHKLYKNFT